LASTTGRPVTSPRPTSPRPVVSSSTTIVVAPKV
jgi:hypothetical protein